jgi:hypothetical protein
METPVWKAGAVSTPRSFVLPVAPEDSNDVRRLDE